MFGWFKKKEQVEQVILGVGAICIDYDYLEDVKPPRDKKGRFIKMKGKKNAKYKRSKVKRLYL